MAMLDKLDKLDKNDVIELTIEDMGSDGAGVGRYEGMTFFVKDAVTGDKVMARITKMKKNYGFARLEKMLKPSEHRVTPECELHSRCGGCQISVLAYGQQLAYKQKKVQETLNRIGGFAPELTERIFEPAAGMDYPYRYRNKAQFPVGTGKDGKLVAGFYAARTHSIIPVSDCRLGPLVNREVLLAVLAYMEENHVEPYDETRGTGLVRHVLIRNAFATNEVMVCLVINGRRLPAQDKLIAALRGVEGLTGILVNQNRKNTNVILGDVTQLIYGRDYIMDSISLRDCGSPDFPRTGESVDYRISPQSFYQVNPEQTEKLYSLVLEYAGLTGKETVWDLYCGIGTISLFLAQRAGKVYGVESVPQAIEDARKNAAQNGIVNAEFFEGKAEDVLPQFYQSEDADVDALHPDVIVVDPPRKGCDERCLEAMIQMRPERIVYVSCDPATLARDLKILCDGGYELKRGRVVDQFCHTVHVETIVLIQKKNS